MEKKPLVTSLEYYQFTPFSHLHSSCSYDIPYVSANGKQKSHKKVYMNSLTLILNAGFKSTSIRISTATRSRKNNNNERVFRPLALIYIQDIVTKQNLLT